MTCCSIPLAKCHPRSSQHILYPFCQADTFSSAAIPFTRRGVGVNCPGSEDLTHPVTLVYQYSSLGFTMQETLHCALSYQFLLSFLWLNISFIDDLLKN